MKTKFQSKFQLAGRAAAITSTLIFVCAGGPAFGATYNWVAGGVGNYNDATKWVGADSATGIPDDAADIAASDGTGSIINYNAGDNYTISALQLNIGSGATIFNQTGGVLDLATLAFGGNGGSRNPTYNLSGGTLNTSTEFSWGFGNNARFNITGGTFNHNGSSLSIGRAPGAHGYIIMTGGVFNANSVGQMNLANSGNGNAQATIDLSGTAAFNATAATVVLGQFGSGTANTFATLNMAGESTFNAANLVLGGNNAGSAVYGVINLNGGTLSAGSIRKGNSTIASSITQNVLHANGGTVRALTSNNNSNFFQNAFVDIQAGGLNFDTNGNIVAIPSVLSGSGGLTKLGEGTLTLGGLNTYAGDTTVNEGLLSIGTTSLDDASTVTVATDAFLELTHGGQDQVAKIILGGEEFTTPGTYGEFGSSAIFQSDFFIGNGVLRIGPASEGRDLVWTGSEGPFWQPAGSTNFTTDGMDAVAFSYNDNVTFDETSTVNTVNLLGVVYPGTVTFNGDVPYILQSSGSPSGIAGAANIIVNNPTSVDLGGLDSAFTGTIAVNAGILRALNEKSFGLSSGISIADGAQVDLNGQATGALYTFTLNGPGPGGAGTIVNGGTELFSTSGVKNLILNASSAIGNTGSRFDIGVNGTITGNGHTLTKVGPNSMAVRGDASGTPINYVIEEGFVWAENTGLAFGGATGTLTVESGAVAGTFGTLEIATPVTLESGSTLRSGTFDTTSTATGTWSGPLTVAGDVTLNAAGGPLVITGSISGTANITKTGGNSATLANSSHVGSTTVSSGELVISNASLADTAGVTIGAAATLNLPHGLQDTVSTLTLGTEQVADGTYGATGNLTVDFTTDRITGAGTLLVSNGPVAAGEFDAWANANITDPANASLKGRLDDPDGDSLTNLQEFLFGADPEAATGSLTRLSSDGSGLVITWVERDTGAVYQLLESSTLAENPWPVSPAIPENAADQTGLPTGYTRRQATISITGGQKFVRVEGVEN